MTDAAEVISDRVDEDANIIFGAVTDPNMKEEVGNNYLSICIIIIIGHL